MRRLSPWMVHAFELSDASAAKVAKVPYVLSVGNVPQEADTSAPVDGHDLEEALHGARQVICRSRSQAHRLLESFGYESVVVPDGVDTERLRSVPGRRSRPLVVCPVDDVSDPDLSLLVDSFVLVASSVPDLLLAVAGGVSPATHAALVERIPRPMKGQLLVLDNADHKKLLSLYGRASVTCMPAASDGSTRTLVESLAVGTPVVCADGGSAAELIDEDAVASGAGARFVAGNPEACASGIERMIERSSGDCDVSDGCRTTASLYDWSFVGPRLVEVYRRAAA